jgi:hypothetical protein
VFEEPTRPTGVEGTLLDRPIAGAVLGLLFAVMGGMLSVLAGQSGHGVYLPWVLVFSGHPLLRGLVWPAIGALVGLRRRRWAAVLGLVLLGTSVLGSVVALPEIGEGYTVSSELRRSGLAAVVVLLAYLGCFVGSGLLLLGSLLAPRSHESE